MNLRFDLQYAWRMVIKSWGYSLMCAVVVALSVGLAVWTNALTYSQVLKPLGFPGSERWYSVQIAATIVDQAAPGVDAYTYQKLLETQHGGENDGALTLPLTVVSDNYFEAMGIRLRAGRLFDRTDNGDSLAVAVVDEKMAARFWPDQNALGKRIRLSASEGDTPLTIVGIVSSVQGSPYRDDADIGSMYQPLRQAVPRAFHVIVKLPGARADARAALQAAAFAVDRDLPLHNLQTLEDYLAAVKMHSSVMIPVFTAISLITAVLAASGLFGLISRSVAQRTQDVGIRRAVGASAWRSISMFLRQGVVYLSVAVVGLGVGIVALPPLSRAIPNILDHVAPVTIGVALLIAIVISTASYLPTRRAVALEPGDALRYE